MSEIRVGFLHSFGAVVVPRLIADFTKASPRVTFTLKEDAAESLGEMVESGALDIAMVSPRPTVPTLAWRSLFRQRLGVAVPRDHRLAGVTEISMADLADESFVTMHPGFGMRRLLDELCAAAQFQPRIVLESSDLSTSTGLVAAGLGITLTPIDGSEYSSAVLILRLTDADAYRDIGMIWNAGRPLPRAVRDFIGSAVNIDCGVPGHGPGRDALI